MSSRLRKELRIMWANVWFRSLCEVIAVAAAMVIFILILQATNTGRLVIEEVKQLLLMTNS